MKRYIILLILPLLTGLFSCNNIDKFFDIRPKSELIFEDFWKDESDVKSAIGACYRGMIEQSFVERLIVWGEVRSDNVIKGKSVGQSISDILATKLLPANEYTTWGSFYSVINNCNNVIKYAQLAKDNDPNFTEGQLQAYIAEAKGIRAFCYFTLVRAFRDVPLIKEPYDDDTKPLVIAQSSPDDILNFLIQDLEGCENQAPSFWENDIYSSKGRITQNAIRALLADMYLWKNDYNNCIKYCDEVLNDNNVVLTLEDSKVYNADVFIYGNSTESIFELQFYNSNNYPNYAVNAMYGTTQGNGKQEQLSAYDLITPGVLFPRYLNFSSNKIPVDLRGKDAFLPDFNNQLFPIKKYLSIRIDNPNGNAVSTDYSGIYTSSNWIIYRLPDIYLMKAEALVELGGDSNLSDAFDLVTKTWNRANPNSTTPLVFTSYNSQALMRDLVFDERQREFLFEGKRYFDLLRRINREGNIDAIVTKYLLRKYSGLDQATIKSNLSDINALYMPINDQELKVNYLLIQNPFYKISSEFQPN